MLVRGALAALVVGLSTARNVAAAPSPPIELRWNAPRECPDDLSLARGVEDVLGERLDEAANQPLAVEAHVHGDGVSGYAAKVSFTSSQGRTERELDHPDCGKLTEGVALLIALAIDPERVRARQERAETSEGRPADPPTEPAPSTTPPVSQEGERPAPSTVRDAPLEAPSPSRRALRANVSVLGLVGSGMLPGAAPGLGSDVALRYRFFEAALTGRFWASRSATIPTTTDASVELSLMTGGIRLCGIPRYERWSAPSCARADAGYMSGHGQSVDNARAKRDGFAALGGSVGLGYELGRISPVVGAELLKIVSRPRFGALADGRDLQAFRPRAWQFSAFIGLSYAL